MYTRKKTFARPESGQSLVETVLMMPVMLLVLFNALNFGYFFLVTLNLSTAPRSGVEYSMLGGQSPGTIGLATATSAADLTYRDVTGAISSPGGATVKVCTKKLGFAAGVASCAICNGGVGGGCGAAANGNAGDNDNEPASFVMQRIDITYTFVPLLPPALFNLTVLAIPQCTSSGGSVSCTFHRHVSMRAID
ncbi:MAG: TadE/TadG family type IV pilus assembly protein [Terriglobales bacterium]